MKRQLGLLAGAIMLSALAARTSSAEVSFQGLGGFPGASVETRALGVSADGSVVVGYGSSVNGTEAFRWTQAGGLQPLGDLPGGQFGSGAFGVSDDGTAVVGSAAPATGGGEAFRWTEVEGMVSLGDFPGGFVASQAYGASADGAVVVGYGSRTGGSEAFRWTSESGLVGLGRLPGGTPGSTPGSGANDVSADGEVVVGGSSSSQGTQAFRWTQATGMVGLGFLPGRSNSGADAISADGSTIVGASEGEAYRWTVAEGMVGLGTIPGLPAGSAAQGVSGDGTRIVGQNFIDDQFGNEAFLWDEAHGMRSVRQLLLTLGVTEVSDWSLQSAQDISADGTTIVGWGFGERGVPEAWVAVIPEPSAWQLALSGVAGALFARFGRRLRNTAV